MSKYGLWTERLTDVAESKLKSFFDHKRVDLGGYVPNIIKYQSYSMQNDLNPNPDVRELHIFQRLADVKEVLPAIAITSFGGAHKRLGIGTQFLGLIFDGAAIDGTVAGPYDLTGLELKFRTRENDTTIIFDSGLFADVAVATAAEVCAVINMLSLYVYAYVDSTTGVIKLACRKLPNRLQILDGSANTALGFVNGTVDDSADYAVKKRYQSAIELNLRLDIGAYDRVTMLELADLVYNYFSLFIEDEPFVPFDWMGDYVNDLELYQIVFKDNPVIGSEVEIDRRESDPYNKVYSVNINMGCIALDYLDKEYVGMDSDGITDVRYEGGTYLPPH